MRSAATLKTMVTKDSFIIRRARKSERICLVRLKSVGKFPIRIG